MTKEEPEETKKMTLYPRKTQAQWLKRKALEESEIRGCEVTASQILREILDQVIK